MADFKYSLEIVVGCLHTRNSEQLHDRLATLQIATTVIHAPCNRRVAATKTLLDDSILFATVQDRVSLLSHFRCRTTTHSSLPRSQKKIWDIGPGPLKPYNGNTLTTSTCTHSSDTVPTWSSQKWHWFAVGPSTFFRALVQIRVLLVIKEFIGMHQSRSGDLHGSYCRPKRVPTCWLRFSNGTPDIDRTSTNATRHHVTSGVPLIGSAAWRLGDRAEKSVGKRLLQIGCSATKKLLCDGSELQVWTRLNLEGTEWIEYVTWRAMST